MYLVNFWSEHLNSPVDYNSISYCQCNSYDGLQNNCYYDYGRDARGFIVVFVADLGRLNSLT